ncbi:hypothetical protein EVJ58_g6203 [Rhodofomes roseus]|uniref:Uncharacterized protein n=1 Tax=Rhodofomes roseus TaxID=34475 RepID=A0A4Y9YB21_9APHY|nr:hypothetical protein EVJ58_g6203 [Rhodofomes roseus]
MARTPPPRPGTKTATKTATKASTKASTNTSTRKKPKGRAAAAHDPEYGRLILQSVFNILPTRLECKGWAKTFCEAVQSARGHGCTDDVIASFVDDACTIISGRFPAPGDDLPGWATELKAGLEREEEAFRQRKRDEYQRLLAKSQALTQGGEEGESKGAESDEAESEEAESEEAESEGDEWEEPEGERSEGDESVEEEERPKKKQRRVEDASTTKSHNTSLANDDDAMVVDPPAPDKPQPSDRSGAGTPEPQSEQIHMGRQCDRCHTMNRTLAQCKMRKVRRTFKCDKCRQDRKGCFFDEEPAKMPSDADAEGETDDAQGQGTKGVIAKGKARATLAAKPLRKKATQHVTAPRAQAGQQGRTLHATSVVRVPAPSMIAATPFPMSIGFEHDELTTLDLSPGQIIKIRVLRSERAMLLSRLNIIHRAIQENEAQERQITGEPAREKRQ